MCREGYKGGKKIKRIERFVRQIGRGAEFRICNAAANGKRMLVGIYIDGDGLWVIGRERRGPRLMCRVSIRHAREMRCEVVMLYFGLAWPGLAWFRYVTAHTHTPISQTAHAMYVTHHRLGRATASLWSAFLCPSLPSSSLSGFNSEQRHDSPRFPLQQWHVPSVEPVMQRQQMSE